MVYLPTPVYQLASEPCAGWNCGCAGIAMNIDRSTRGDSKTTSGHVRTLIRPAGCHPSTHDQHRYVARVQYGLLLEQDNKAAWSGLTSRSAKRGFGVYVSYAPLVGTKHDCFRGKFSGIHEMYVNGRNPDGTWKVMDPGADGRYAGCPKGYQDYPDALLSHIAGLARDPGFASVLFTLPDTVVKKYKASIAGRPGGTPFFVYHLSNGVIKRIPNGRSIAHTGGFTATCTAPRVYKWPGVGERTLVKLTSGSRDGQYIEAKNAYTV